MRSRIIIAIIISIIILSHCKEDREVEKEILIPDKNKIANISFRLNKKIKFSDIGLPSIALTEDQDEIYVYGKSLIIGSPEFIVKIYNKEFKYLSQKLFHYGQGPGDVGNTNIITPDKEKIYISENSNLRVSIYNKNFEYIRSVNHKGIATYPFELFENGRFFISSSLVYEKKNFEAYAFKIVSFPELKVTNFYKTAPFYPYDDKNRLLLGDNTEYSYFYDNKNIFLLLMKKYQILKFDLNGKKIKDLTIKVNEIKTKKDKISYYLQSHGYANKENRFGFSETVTPTSWMIPLKNCFVVLRRQDYSTDCNGLVDGDYFSYEVEFSGKVKIPCFYNVYKITGGMLVQSYKYDNKFLYIINEVDDDFYLERWEVKE